MSIRFRGGLLACSFVCHWQWSARWIIWPPWKAAIPVPLEKRSHLLFAKRSINCRWIMASLSTTIYCEDIFIELQKLNSSFWRLFWADSSSTIRMHLGFEVLQCDLLTYKSFWKKKFYGDERNSRTKRKLWRTNPKPNAFKGLKFRSKRYAKSRLLSETAKLSKDCNIFRHSSAILSHSPLKTANKSL